MENKAVLFFNCKECGERIGCDVELFSRKKHGKSLCLKCMEIRDLKVFVFENGEADWVIARDLDEAKEYYATDVVGYDEINEFEINELPDWHNKTVRVEDDDNCWIDETVLNVAKEMYENGYDGANVIASTCI